MSVAVCIFDETWGFAFYRLQRDRCDPAIRRALAELQTPQNDRSCDYARIVRGLS
ncbi:hypothetical protein RBSWK_06403 [Rhodopirellula baltica SWK14]|uniref:Uncharacterized protein n=1 Tax=Rhodopirellula baltica SWK14 TaxID=993516 RepID=L7C7P5_RHOBT|nr:hypothetical protein RBSWK_06403 [Rhodopirellula baltica SWK14]